MAVSPGERKQLLGQLSALAGEDLDKLWRIAGSLSQGEFARFILDAFPELVDQYASVASTLAADWYEQTAPGSLYRPVDAPLTPQTALQSSAQWALNTTTGSDALALLAGTLQRAIFNGARDTTALNVERERGARWARHASANACPFCKMLATRGAVYASESSASRVGGRGKEMSAADRRDRAAGRTRRSNTQGNAQGQFLAGGIKARGNQALGKSFHDNCHCVAIEVRPGGPSYQPAPYVERWEREYQDARRAAKKGEYGAVSAKDLMSAWRQLETSQN